jgi:hypothetical protein
LLAKKELANNVSSQSKIITFSFSFGETLALVVVVEEGET